MAIICKCKCVVKGDISMTRQAKTMTAQDNLQWTSYTHRRTVILSFQLEYHSQLIYTLLIWFVDV